MNSSRSEKKTIFLCTNFYSFFVTLNPIFQNKQNGCHEHVQRFASMSNLESAEDMVIK